MAPEVLSRSLQPGDFLQFKMSDMYSYALVVWEILRRVEWQDTVFLMEATQERSATDSGYNESSEKAVSPRIQHMQKPSLNLVNRP